MVAGALRLDGFCRTRSGETLGRFLCNHKHEIAAMDLFTVPTLLRLLYGFFVIVHGRRHIVHFNYTQKKAGLSARLCFENVPSRRS